MSSKRKTPARKKTTPAHSPVSAAFPPSTPDVQAEPAAALIPAPVQRGKLLLSSLPSSSSPSSPSSPSSLRFTNEDRHRMIAKTAYGYAEKGGFRNNPVEDWLMAEREVEAKLQQLAS